MQVPNQGTCEQIVASRVGVWRGNLSKLFKYSSSSCVYIMIQLDVAVNVRLPIVYQRYAEPKRSVRRL